MKYHAVINACSDDYKKQMMEIRGFIEECCFDMEEGETFILCKEEADRKELAKAAPTRAILFLIQDFYQPETAIEALGLWVNTEDVYLFPSNFAGNELAVRCSIKMNGSSITGAIQLRNEDEKLIVSKMVYSNHMQGNFQMLQLPAFLSVAKGIWQQEGENVQYHIVAEIDSRNSKADSFVLQRVSEKCDRAKSWQSTYFLVTAGRGVKSKEAVKELEKWTKELGGELGISRPVAMNAWGALERLVGISGAMLKPELCIAAGVSGAAALYAGIEKSKFIVAVNTDEHAPIMKKADVVIIDDYKSIMEALVICRQEDIG